MYIFYTTTPRQGFEPIILLIFKEKLMRITVEFSDGSYLQVEDKGDFCVYESPVTDFQGRLEETLSVLPRVRKRDILKSMFILTKRIIGGNYDYSNGGNKAS